MFCVQCGKKVDNTVTLPCRKSGRAILLIGMLCCFMLSGCGSKDSMKDENVVMGTADNGEPAEEASVVDEEKEALEAELAEAKAELAKAQEALAESEEDAIKDAEESEEPERLMVTEVSEEELKRAEYLLKLHSIVDGWMHNWNNYKFTFYADDIDKDGLPELIMLGDRNTGIGEEKELVFLFIHYALKYNEETHRWEHIAEVEQSTFSGCFFSDIAQFPESGVIDFSYTADGSNILYHYYSSGGHQSPSHPEYKIVDELYIYRDNEVLSNGRREKSFYEFANGSSEFRYLTRDADYKGGTDEELYNNFVIPECDKTVRLTARSGWGTVDEALEHLGELP